MIDTIQFNSLERGDIVSVRFGSRGRQVAIIHGRTRTGNLRALKYISATGRWTPPIRVNETDILEISPIETAAIMHSAMKQLAHSG
ncbi:hypothetical protein [Azorhizobium caulinodans]|uniref:hypothetical protein n=1 Tax=Azorhizobium caulinodans TaxID=7 RepID=UPI002FBEE20C